MNAIEQVKERLRQYPSVRYDAGESHITIHPLNEDGFPVSLSMSPEGYSVSFDGWHEEFASEAEALNCLAFGLSPECRLRVEYRGQSPYKRTVEDLQDSHWREESTTGLAFYPFWRPRRTLYRQNRVVAGDRGK